MSEYNEFDSVDEAKVGATRHPKIAAGTFLFEVTNAQRKVTLRHGTAFIAELKVLESNNPEHPRGSTVSFYVDLTDQTKAGPKLKKFTIAVLGLDPNAAYTAENGLIKKSLKAACDKGYFNGKHVRCHATNEVTKEAPGEPAVAYVRTNWSSVDQAAAA